MDDPQIESLLRRYQPAGPPPALRVRVLATPTVGRAWPWAVAAAALLALTFALQISTARLTRATEVTLAVEPAALAVDALAELLDGDVMDRTLAEAVVAEQQMRIEAEALLIEPAVAPTGAWR